MQIDIYVTDDDSSFRTTMGHALEKSGYRYSLCSNSDELIAVLNATTDPAIIYLDVNMDGQDGIETIERLRSIDRPFRLRFVTGGDVATSVAASLIAKAHDFDVSRTLFKPFPLSDFYEALQEDSFALMN